MTGLIVEGGASRTYFAVGVMDALMENKIKRLEIKDNSVSLNFKPYEINTIMVVF